jgi:large subunit ribosomal protein L29
MSSLDTAELATKSREAEEQLFRLRFQMGMGQYEGLKKYRALKKDRARMLTEMAERKKNEANAAAVEGIQSADKAHAGAAPKVAARKAHGVAEVKKTTAAAAVKKPAAKAKVKKPAAKAAAHAKKPDAKKHAAKEHAAKKPAAKAPAAKKSAAKKAKKAK